MDRPHDKPMVPASTNYRDDVLLASYAFHDRDSQGRKHDELEHPYRGPFQRDRDRIVHSAAFRRLSGKMQVFTRGMGDYHRTRLTHTMEVTSIARTMARALRLNEDLVEALALLHDLGHPPFGHAGEDALNEFLADEGGFSHNQHALTIVEDLEESYQPFRGLNLTNEVLAGQIARIDKSDSASHPLLEVQVVDLADSIAYNAHDVDDAIKLELVRLDDLCELSLPGEAVARVQGRYDCESPTKVRKAVVHELIDWQVGDVIQESRRALADWIDQNWQAVRDQRLLLRPSEDLSHRAEELHTFLYERVYRHPEIVSVRHEAQMNLKTMFQGYCREPALMPESFRGRAETVGLKRSIAEYLAGMTDRYCLGQFQHLFQGRNESD